MTLQPALVLGAVLLLMALGESLVRRWPLSPALVYLGVGWAAAQAGVSLSAFDARGQAQLLRPACEAVLLFSLFAIGLRLGAPARRDGWRPAAVLASTGMLATIVLIGLAAWSILPLTWAGALLLATMLAPTDPVLASDVQIRSDQDRDTVRLALTAEGALNDGTAYPVVVLALAALGLHDVGPWGSTWLLRDLLWPVVGGLALGWTSGRALGRALQALAARGHALAWDELLYLGIIALLYGTAVITGVSSFLGVFACGCAIFFVPVAGQSADAVPPAAGAPEARTATAAVADLGARMMAFGARLERIAEVLMVMLIGASMAWARLDPPLLGFVAAALFVARPAAVLLVLAGRRLPRGQRWRIAWFGVRGVGSLYYLSYALEAGLPSPVADTVTAACMACIAGSIVVHGISATPLMAWRRRDGNTPRR